MSPCKGKTRTPDRCSRAFRDSHKARAQPDLRARVVVKRGARRRLARATGADLLDLPFDRPNAGPKVGPRARVGCQKSALSQAWCPSDIPDARAADAALP